MSEGTAVSYSHISSKQTPDILRGKNLQDREGNIGNSAFLYDLVNHDRQPLYGLLLGALQRKFRGGQL